MRLISRRFVLWAAAGVLASGCLSPTLPLPPPAVPDIKDVGSGQYELSGTLPEPGFVLALNKRTNVVSGQLATEAYVIRIEAQPEDPMQLWYETGTNDVSDIVEFAIPKTRTVAPPDSGTGGAGDAGP